MKNSQFEAKTFGVGELIMQRKLFRVPPHQRSFAWGKESVEEFLRDIDLARTNGAADYFVGLIVIQGSNSGEWILLDGQQRLTTVTLIFSGIRYWLHSAGFVEDAQQINHEYLGVRRLGGEYSSRMLLNTENQGQFAVAATELNSDKELWSRIRQLSKKSSNRLLLEAAIACRAWVSQVAGDKSLQNVEGAARLYSLARFLDSKLKIVAVEVSSEVDAYVLFEALNDRGVALSALDLIKNYIFSKNSSEETKWVEFLGRLADADPEDFLKVFWTSRYGVIQKSQIFKGVKEVYDTPQQASVLVAQMTEDAEVLAALYDDDHFYWSGASEGVRDQIFLLRILESKQARPLLIAVLRTISNPEIALEMIRMIAVAIVRFQVVGKGRTGVVEKVVGRLCTGVSSFSITTVHEFKSSLQELFLADNEFKSQFEMHGDSKYSRVAYLLAEDLAFQILPAESSTGDRVKLVRQIVEKTRLVRIFAPQLSYAAPEGQDPFTQIGNFRLELSHPAIDSGGLDLRLDEVNQLSLELDPGQFVLDRTLTFAQRAPRVWSVEVGAIP